MRVIHRHVVLLAVLYFLPGIVPRIFSQDLKCFVLSPPEQILEGVKQIAIADFAVTSSYDADVPPSQKSNKTIERILTAVGKISEAEKHKSRFKDSGLKLSNMMTAALIREDRGVTQVGTGFLGLAKKEGRSFQEGATTNVFTVVERERLQQVLKEVTLGQSGVVDEGSAAEVGRLLGVDAIIVGNVNVSFRDRWFKENREDKQKRTYEVDCERRTANVTAAIRIVNIETGAIIGSKSSHKKQEKKHCRGEGGSLDTPEVLVDKCLSQIANELVDYFAPCFEYQKLKFAKIKAKDFKHQQEIAKKALEAYDLDTAYLQYAAIVEQDPYNHAANFNLGALHEAVGNYRQAQEKYNLAYKLKSKEGKYRDARKRVAKQVGFWNQLNKLGISLEEHEFQVSEEEIAEATRARVETKGPSSARYEIKAAPGATSETLVKVPGEIELELIETVGGWYKIRLPDGKEGFIQQSNVKELK